MAGTESDAEYLVLIVIREQEHSRSRLLMFQKNPLGIQLFYVFFIQDLILFKSFTVMLSFLSLKRFHSAYRHLLNRYCSRIREQ